MNYFEKYLRGWLTYSKNKEMGNIHHPKSSKEMNDNQLKEILFKHDTNTEGDSNEYFLTDIISAMREAMEKESIDFINWKRDNWYSWDSVGEYWFKWEQKKELRFTTKQLYNHYKNNS